MMDFSLTENLIKLAEGMDTNSYKIYTDLLKASSSLDNDWVKNVRILPEVLFKYIKELKNTDNDYEHRIVVAEIISDAIKIINNNTDEGMRTYNAIVKPNLDDYFLMKEAIMYFINFIYKMLPLYNIKQDEMYFTNFYA